MTARKQAIQKPHVALLPIPILMPHSINVRFSYRFRQVAHRSESRFGTLEPVQFQGLFGSVGLLFRMNGLLDGNGTYGRRPFPRGWGLNTVDREAQPMLNQMLRLVAIPPHSDSSFPSSPVASCKPYLYRFPRSYGTKTP